MDLSGHLNLANSEVTVEFGLEIGWHLHSLAAGYPQALLILALGVGSPQSPCSRPWAQLFKHSDALGTSELCKAPVVVRKENQMTAFSFQN